MTCSGDQKVTTMVLKVDLGCCSCYRKVKKVLCKFPQIRDQVYDEKTNTVTITVVCCSPERIMEKLCRKGGKSIRSIEIKQPKKPQPDQPKKPQPAPAPVEPEKPKPKPTPEPEKPKPKPEAPVPVPIPVPVPQEKPPEIKKNGSKNGSKNGCKPGTPAPAPAPKPAEKPPKPAEQAPAPAPAPTQQEPGPMQPCPPEPQAQWVPAYPPGPPPQVYPVSICCGPCSEGRPGGPCYDGGGYGGGPGYGYQYGRPPCPPGYYGSRCDYFSEENPSSCSIM